MTGRLKRVEIQEDNPFVLSIGDLMAALLLIFVLLLSATLLMLQTQYSEAIGRTEQIQEIAKTYKGLREELYEALYNEFRDDLSKWKAEIFKETLTIRFKEPSIYFDTGKANLKEDFKAILSDFFPRYVNVLFRDKYKENIEEIRIEGHTSSEWHSNMGGKEPYFLNMDLSQNRTRSVLEFGLSQIDISEMKAWAKDKITANGLSSSKLIMVDNKEDKEASRRVEFRVRTDAEKRIGDILRSTKND